MKGCAVPDCDLPLLFYITCDSHNVIYLCCWGHSSIFLPRCKNGVISKNVEGYQEKIIHRHRDRAGQLYGK